MPSMTGSRYFAEAMQTYGVTHVFLVPTIVTPALAEMEGMNITRVTAHSEKSAVYMADGYARASHRPGVSRTEETIPPGLLSNNVTFETESRKGGR